MGVEKEQKDILTKSISFINKNEIIDRLSGLLYLNSWDSYSIGNTFLKYKIIGSIPKWKFFRNFIKNLFSIRHLSNIKFKRKHSFFFNYNSIIFSWCKYSDFDDLGNYHDRYFNTCSKDNKDFLWFLISLDNKIPKNIDDNIQILFKGKSNYFSILNLFFKTLFKNIFIRREKLISISYERVFAEKIIKVVESSYIHNIKRIIQPYEAQPFQHAINLSFQKYNIKTIGYLHSLLPSLPTDLIYRVGAPDILYVHGLGQIEIMNKFLNWNNNKLKFIKSFRFRKNDFLYSGNIFISYDFSNEKVILDSFEFFLKKSEFKSLPFLKVKAHPVKLSSSKHIKLIKNINFLINKYENRFDSKNQTKFSIVIGVSAVILEALERDVETIIHIIDNPILESHQNFLWKEISVVKINHNTYKYRLNHKKHYIHLGDNNLTLKNLI